MIQFAVLSFLVLWTSGIPFLLSLFLCSICNITRIVSTVKRWVLIILWRFCERYEPCKMVKITPCKFTCEGVYFCYFIGRQPYSEGIYSRAVHDVTFSFARRFLDLTTFLRQIFGKIYSSDFLTRITNCSLNSAILWK